jgi:RNA recognition motif-containing protein
VTIRGLPRTANDESVRAFFGPCGALKKVRLGRPSEIIFETAEGAAAAVGLNGKTFPGDERELAINLSIRKGARRAAQRAKAAEKGTSAPAPARGPKGAGAGPAPATGGRARRVDVIGAPAGVSEDAVKSFFAGAGVVERVLIREDSSVDITFATPEGATAAVAMSGSSMSGSAIAVAFQPSRARVSKTPRASGAGAATESGAGRKRVAEPVNPEEVANLVWISGLAEGADEASVRSSFAGFGKIASVTVKSNKARTFAYVKYETAAAAEKALASAPNGLTVQKASRPPRA